MESIYIEIELYEEDGKKYVFLSHDGSSGCKYEINDVSDLKEIVGDYVANTYYDELDLEEENVVEVSNLEQRITKFDIGIQNKLMFILEAGLFEKLEDAISKYDKNLTLKTDELRYHGGWLLTDDWCQIVNDCLKIIEKFYQSTLESEKESLLCKALACALDLLVNDCGAGRGELDMVLDSLDESDRQEFLVGLIGEDEKDEE